MLPTQPPPSEAPGPTLHCPPPPRTRMALLGRLRGRVQSRGALGWQVRVRGGPGGEGRATTQALVQEMGQEGPERALRDPTLQASGTWMDPGRPSARDPAGSARCAPEQAPGEPTAAAASAPLPALPASPVPSPQPQKEVKGSQSTSLVTVPMAALSPAPAHPCNNLPVSPAILGAGGEVGRVGLGARAF